jgi:bidirectional [NiFe] hydrogenase diaphorase subunit
MPAVGINGQCFSIGENTTILEIAIEKDIFIPTLCYSAEVSPGARCKVCVVEVTAPIRKDPLVLACTYKIKEDTEVLTNSPRTLKSRKEAMRKLLALAPNAPRIREMAENIGISTQTLDFKGKGCILCGLCVRACREVVGRAAITFKRIGKRETAIHSDPDRCIACGTCAYICPTGYIRMVDHEDGRIIWNKLFKKRGHLISGKYFAPMDALKKAVEREGVSEDLIDTRHQRPDSVTYSS